MFLGWHKFQKYILIVGDVLFVFRSIKFPSYTRHLSHSLEFMPALIYQVSDWNKLHVRGNKPFLIHRWRQFCHLQRTPHDPWLVKLDIQRACPPMTDAIFPAQHLMYVEHIMFIHYPCLNLSQLIMLNIYQWLPTRFSSPVSFLRSSICHHPSHHSSHQ